MLQIVISLLISIPGLGARTEKSIFQTSCDVQLSVLSKLPHWLSKALMDPTFDYSLQAPWLVERHLHINSHKNLNASSAHLRDLMMDGVYKEALKEVELQGSKDLLLNLIADTPPAPNEAILKYMDRLVRQVKKKPAQEKLAFQLVDHFKQHHWELYYILLAESVVLHAGGSL